MTGITVQGAKRIVNPRLKTQYEGELENLRNKYKDQGGLKPDELLPKQDYPWLMRVVEASGKKLPVMEENKLLEENKLNELMLMHVTESGKGVLGISENGLRVHSSTTGMLGPRTVYFAEDIAKSSQLRVPNCVHAVHVHASPATSLRDVCT